MIFETWFLLAVVSALAAGIASFLIKVAAKEQIDIVILTFYTAIITSVVMFGATWYFAGLEAFWHPMLLFAGVTAGTYLMTNVTKVRSLESIDAAIFFPLYKVFGPALVIVFGMIFFEEEFTFYEWVGLVLSLLIPLLLISKAEDARQINLRQGLVWLAITVAIGAVSAATWKHGADIAPNTWMYILAAELFVLFSAAGTLLQKHRGNTLKKLLAPKNSVFYKTLVTFSVMQAVGGSVTVFAFTTGGSLGIVYTINSLYILIPIILSIMFYNEHWNARKAFAITLSVVALAFFA